MRKIARIALIPIMLMSITALFSVTGCATNGTGPAESLPDDLSQQQLEEILIDAMTKYEQLNTYKFNADMNMSTEVIGGSEPGEIIMNYQMAGGVNAVSQQMQINMEMNMSGMGLGVQDVYAEMYVFPDWTYMKMEMPGIGDQWVKMPTSEELSSSYNTGAIDLQIELLDSPLEIVYLRSETVDGFDCYVIDITPNMGELTDWLNQQNTGIEDIDLEGITDISSVYENLSYVCYIIKDTHMIKKMVIEMQTDFTPEQAAMSVIDFDTMEMNIYVDMNIYDYNEPFSVTLPDEAENAVEIPDYMM